MKCPNCGEEAECQHCGRPLEAGRQGVARWLSQPVPAWILVGIVAINVLAFVSAVIVTSRPLIPPRLNAGPPTVVVAQVVNDRPATGRSCGVHLDYRPMHDRPPDNLFRWHVDNQTGRDLYVSVDFDGQLVAGPALAAPSADLDFRIDNGTMYSLLVTSDRAGNAELCQSILAAAPTGTDHVGWSN